jgi:hypothetical protein
MTAVPDSKALRSAVDERAAAVAAFLLACADSLSVKVASDGDSLITVSTSRVPFETIRWLEAELVKNNPRRRWS